MAPGEVAKMGSGKMSHSSVFSVAMTPGRVAKWHPANRAPGKMAPVLLQVEGAFVQGLGLQTVEEVAFEPGTGRLLTENTWLYKIPTPTDIPQQFNVAFLEVGD
jgi:Molybdopterin-binding domain of aldehyde dehydrogenase